MQNTIIYKGIEIIESNGYFVFWYRNTQYTNTNLHFAKRMITREINFYEKPNG